MKTFNSVPCQSYAEFMQNTCNTQMDGIQAFMGIDADSRLKGNFYLQTNAQDPFNRGELGTIYIPEM